ncbi:MAG: hypothetical protein COY42_15830 [Armatimonadetes bacterium CG_4_10_14_0_8_um_filter_66_14]|nr:hypothetical protein [Armatimonadota bacterium]OIP00056.1 MAG: hypothetical protein AUJ96_18915 [Armatimonadetes bacterium CG2_30_66_41]PIU88368.1 MAG: hypothetical protein COS65_30815 [Armatimonadetes bacterium CG06_land_8_20_14_3_00_66_21]PIX37448.1 MAG: hypothetical protein COZ57_34305 [Armatimonadetes bacterium CG_4_8_14_3_um_filter_66_20]PIZ43449.1 MAG: hypothetical protein COY42_15830 [Armatimonadetes bacterium CG_4_10_14_0_8_um_filter_66_14]PJB64828.1 MAG: hypothetical protein CO096_
MVKIKRERVGSRLAALLAALSFMAVALLLTGCPKKGGAGAKDQTASQADMKAQMQKSNDYMKSNPGKGKGGR